MFLPVEQASNPFTWYQRMRETRPVYYDEEHCSWSVFRYEDVRHVLTDYETFSSQMMEGTHLLGASIINLDPPRHRKLRSLVTQAFTPRAITGMAPRITTIVQELLDQAATCDRIDVIDDLAYPLPVIVIAEMLGVPTKDRARFKLWSDLIVGTNDGGGAAYQQEMRDYFITMLEQRRREPQNDLLTALQEAHIDGEHLSVDEMVSFCLLLLVAGNITTTNLIGNAFYSFHEYPQALEQLYADPSLVPGAIEEVLRYHSPVSRMFRVTLSEAVVGGQRIEPGRLVIAWIGSANRDAEVFPEADNFDIRRTPNPHIAFGHGIHFCLGAPLARLEAKIALEAMLARLKHIRMIEDVPLEPLSDVILHGFRHMPIAFEAV
jgi:cytochrome P450